MPHRTDLALRSETGPRRQNNEDAAGALEAPLTAAGVDGVYVVADGLGGHAHGEVASRMAVETVISAFGTAPGGAPLETAGVEERLDRAVRWANDLIYAAGMTGESLHMNPERPGMGTTLTALVLAGDKAVIGHVGDSRAYLYRDGLLRQLTEDHSVVAEQVRRGLLTPHDARMTGLRNVLTQAVGTRESVTPYLRNLVIKMGDVFLLCSDGLWTALEDIHLERLLASGGSSQALVDELVREALRRDGSDNTTALVVQLA